MTVTEQKPLGVRHSELLDELEKVGGFDLSNRTDELIGELMAEAQDRAVGEVAEPKPSTGRIWLIPHYFGGDGAKEYEDRMGKARVKS
jgi:hypothetical protein